MFKDDLSLQWSTFLECNYFFFIFGFFVDRQFFVFLTLLLFYSADIRCAGYGRCYHFIIIHILAFIAWKFGVLCEESERREQKKTIEKADLQEIGFFSMCGLTPKVLQIKLFMKCKTVLNI